MVQSAKNKFVTDEEMRAVFLLAHIEMPNNNIIDAKHFSNWNRLQRTMAYALRFIDNLKRIRRKGESRVGPFAREEYNHARNVLIRQAQREEFLDEILIARLNESLPADGKRKEFHKSSALRACSPYLDKDGLLRVRGRIDAEKSVAYKTKRPIILPRYNYITKSLVYSYLRRYHHINHKNTRISHQTIFLKARQMGFLTLVNSVLYRDDWKAVSIRSGIYSHSHSKNKVVLQSQATGSR